MSEAYNIVYSFSDLYAKIAGISILSLLKNNADLNLHIHILADRLSIQNKNKLIKTVNDYKQIISFYDISTKLESIKNIISYNGGKATYSKFFIADIVTSTDKVLYIDSDTIVNGSISELTQINLHDKAMGMSLDCTSNKYKDVIKLQENSYFNAGVVIIDLQLWRLHNCAEKIMAAIQEGQSYPLAEQDLLNVVLQSDIFRIPFTYNFLSQYSLYKTVKSIAFIFGIKEILNLKNEFTDAQKKPVIYHFSGNTFIRPWYKNSKHPMKTLYDSYYFQSEWKNEPQQQFVLPLPYKIQYIIWKYFPKILFYLFSKIMQRIFIFITYKV